MEGLGNPAQNHESTNTTLSRRSLAGHTKLRGDGRVDIHLDNAFFRNVSRLVPDAIDAQDEDLPPYSPQEDNQTQSPSESIKPECLQPVPNAQSSQTTCPLRLNIVIQVVGSRGDVQPFVALGNALQSSGHRVRLATHDVFESFVRSAGLEFFAIGGDPSQLMAYMVKNPGLIPSMDSLVAGDIQQKRKMVGAMLDGCWRSCIEADAKSGAPFVADAIIANPPSFAHVHCAQALGVPLHIMFTMPWTSTRKFPHPLANLVVEEGAMVNPHVANYMSYGVVEWLTWQGLGDVINDWRATVDLEPVPTSEGPLLTETLGIPVTYCWSPALVPKPIDWAANINICGFFFRDPPPYSPPPDLEKFIQSGPPPIYIGFGSIVIDNPAELTGIILQAVRSTGVRAIISKGWGNLGEDQVGASKKIDSDPDVFYLTECPHEWLFQYVAAVIHHGGAGTTACGLLNGRPTTIVPFFGDQPFWGEMVAAAGAGPRPIPYKKLNVENLASAIDYCLSPEASDAAKHLAEKIGFEKGVNVAVESFHEQLRRNGDYEHMRCDIIHDHPAVWSYKSGSGRRWKLSKLAAEILMEYLKIEKAKLRRLELNPITVQNRRWDPLTGTASSLLSTGKGMLKGATDIVTKPVQIYQSRHVESQGQTQPIKNSGIDVAVTAAAASASGVGLFFKSMWKGFLLDMPLAATEGLRNVPKLYGEDVKDIGAIKDWKSGGIVAGKHFTTGLREGFTDLFSQPINGSRHEGAAGVVKGLGKGLVSFATKVPSAPLGLVAYSFAGVYQSIRSLNSRTKDVIRNRTLVEGCWLLSKAEKRGDTIRLDQMVLEAFCND